MHFYAPMPKEKRSNTARLIISLLCIVVLLSSCSDMFGSASSSTSTTASSSPTGAKTDATGIATAEKLRKAMAKVDQLMQGMTLEEKLGQLLMVEYVGVDYQQSGLQNMITQQHVGGFLVQPDGDGNFNQDTTIASVNAFNAQAQQDAKVPLLIALDQEGGLVNKLYALFGDTPAASTLPTMGGTDVALQEGTKFAQELKQTGFNTNLAPVVDVGPTTTLLNTRKFSDDPQTVAAYAGAFLDGVQNSGVIGTLKHFPGLGSLPQTDDPHAVIVHDTRTLAALESRDFIPYKQLIQKNHPAMLMTTDVYTDAIDPNIPAEISPKVIAVLRNEMNFSGVIITDGIYMLQRAGYTNSIADVTTQAIIAGNDMVEGPYDTYTVSAIIQELQQSIQSGKLSQQQVDASVQRILLMKVQYGIIK